MPERNESTEKKEGRRQAMDIIRQTWDYYSIRFAASREKDRERGEVSATTVVMAAALVALAISVSAIITQRVRDKANSINLG